MRLFLPLPGTRDRQATRGRGEGELRRHPGAPSARVPPRAGAEPAVARHVTAVAAVTPVAGPAVPCCHHVGQGPHRDLPFEDVSVRREGGMRGERGEGSRCGSPGAAGSAPRWDFSGRPWGAPCPSWAPALEIASLSAGLSSPPPRGVCLPLSGCYAKAAGRCARSRLGQPSERHGRVQW